MCGIVGYIGDRQAVPFVMKGLKKLEYRGYDSAGIAVFDGEKLDVIKAKGKLDALQGKLDGIGGPAGTVGVGHTRWATHGAPSDENSHPHTNTSGTIAVIHNGIVENYIPLKEFLIEKGYVFRSETDTEVVAHLLDYYYNGDMTDALIKVLKEIRGSYAFEIMTSYEPDKILAVRKDSPLIVGLGEGENYIASDIPAVLESTRSYYMLNDNEIVILKKDSVTIIDVDKNEIKKDVFTADWDVSAAQKGGYEHFMMKEIMEQPKAVKEAVSHRLSDSGISFDEISLTDEDIKSIERIHIVACGSAYHAGVVGKYAIEELARIPVEADLASEFRYRSPIVGKNDLFIAISQSGETADSLAALREAKRQGARVLSVVNVVGSSIARESDDVLYTWAGPEIAVATTKGYSTQVALMYLIAVKFAYVKGKIDEKRYAELTDGIKKLPELIEKLLGEKEKYKALAGKYAKGDVFIIGRGTDYAVAMEGSLKLKEISYIHSEAYAAGELKHGTISLIEDGTLVIAVASVDKLLEKMISNIKEVKARGACVMALAKEGSKELEGVADEVVYIPETEDIFTSVLDVIPLQIFAYYASVLRGCDVDMPRNLAKSVTVE